MLKSRLNRLEKTLRPKTKELPYVMCYEFLDGTCEYQGQKFVNKEEFKTAINPKNVIYLMHYGSGLMT